MDEIIRMFTNNVGNKLTLELANGMVAVIEKKIQAEIDNALQNAENTVEGE